jgi:hypothetical protein
MKAVDYFMCAVTMAAFVAFFVSPDKWGFRLMLFSFVAIAIWCLFYPRGIIGWARTAHPQIDPNDPSMWWFPRLFGGVVLFVVILGLLRGWRFTH